MLKRIVSIQDISCFGKCSLTVALPILSAMGVETAVVPTAVLSTHTGGFTGYTFRDLTDDIPEIARHWESLGIKFDGIYTGYLGSIEQVNIVSDFFDQFKSDDTKIIVDPVMGDAGRMYAGFTSAFAAEMKKLCGKADVIVPNMTEVSLLLDVPYTENYDEAYVREMLRKLTDLGCDTAVITGICYGDGKHGAVAYDKKTDTFSSSFERHIDCAAHGTGDIFSSTLSGSIINGGTLQEALDTAVSFTFRSIEATLPDIDEYWYGVSFEKCLGMLTK
ncbi:MAG: pyridoxamine kinase [Oscillospiraceae bacterium]|nr:pyridoxamine kinase [Oscillospiraceae bacterium]